MRGYFVTAGLFSLAINLLYLAGPLYMLQVYDRVVSSGSVTTLTMLTLALLLAYGALSGLDFVRSRVLSRAGIRLDSLLADRVVAATLEQPSSETLRSQPLRDFDTFRQFITGSGIHAIFDLPWAPLYLIVIFLLHPLLGAFALLGIVVLSLMALVNEWMVRRTLSQANDAATRNYGFTDMSLRNAEVVRAMGMAAGLLKRWARDRDLMLERQLTASDRAARMSSAIKFTRMTMQSLVLGIGAYLAIERFASVGVMFAASMLLGRTLQPVEQVVGGWRGFVSARDAFARIKRLLEASPPNYNALILPRPTGRLDVQSVVFGPAGSPRPIIKGISFSIAAGEALGIIGPSGAGKSTLARLLVGVAAANAGAVRLDGADIAIWPKSRLGRHVGYLPQDVELFADTIGANIGRFERGDDSKAIEAARLAGVHEMILALPQGYDTQVGEGGAVLSGGYRQRIGLARAVFGNPAYIVLDEPSSNLDSAGDAALAECIERLKQMGTTIVLISHRTMTIASVDKLLVLRDGMIEAFGGRQEVIARISGPAPLKAVPNVVVASTASAGAA